MGSPTMTRTISTTTRLSLQLPSLTWSLLTLFLLTLSVTMAETLKAGMTSDYSLDPLQDWEEVEARMLDWGGQERRGLANIRMLKKRQSQFRVIRSDRIRYHRCYFNPVSC